MFVAFLLLYVLGAEFLITPLWTVVLAVISGSFHAILAKVALLQERFHVVVVWRGAYPIISLNFDLLMA